MKKIKHSLAAILAILVMILAAAGISGCASKKADTIPVITLEGEYLNDYTNWNDKSTYYPAKLTYTDGKTTFTKEVEIKPQGTSSMAYPKKNITVKFAEGVEFSEKWGTQKKFVLKADYIDPTNSCNVVSANLVAEMNKAYGLHEDTPNYGAIGGFPVFVKINGEDAGTFSLTIPKDPWMLNMDSDNPNHLVLCCEGWTDACSMRGYDIDFEADWTFEIGEATEESMAAFTRVVQFVATADDETFVRDFDQYLNLDACINYICFVNTSFGFDNVTKNLLMATYDGQVWYPILYDLDTLWGIDWLGTGLADQYHTSTNELLTDGNNLFARVTRLFGDQVRERYLELRQGILSKEHIIESFETYTSRIPQEYYDINNALWYSDGTHIRSIELMSQQMDKYLPVIDNCMMEVTAAPSAATVPAETETAPAGAATGNQAAALTAPMIHYVWETNGVQHSLENIQDLPVATTVRYTLDGKTVTAEEVAGKSGKLELTLRVERKANADAVYGIAAVVQVENAQCKNLTVTGGSHSVSAEKNADVCTGSAWLNNTDTAYEMKLTMDVTDFAPAEYIVTVTPVVAGGGDPSLNALLTAASELTAIVNEGVTLHTSLTEWHTYLTNVQNGLAQTAAMAETLVPAEASGQQNAADMMKALLSGAEAEADALLNTLGYSAAADMTSEKRLELLSQAAADTKHTEEEKAQADKLQEQIGAYLVVANQLQSTQEAATAVSTALNDLSSTMPDLVGAYAYANDTLYAILYKVSTLYQNIANYYAAVGNGGGWVASGVWNDVIIFTNHDIIQ